VLKDYGAMPLGELSAIVRTLFDPVADLFEEELAQEDKEDIGQSSFAKRLVTGRAAEGFFRANYDRQEQWRGGSLIDTTATGCGFDFRINFENSSAFHAVEVKGMFDSCGSIMLTEKEHLRAGQLRDRFFLYVVRNFRKTPFASVWRDPLNAELEWELLSQQQTVNSWRTGL
jgi:hypothetical protein